MALTIKQQAFVHAYLETGNASEAYRRAYDAQNMKPETVKVKASELLRHGNVAVTVEAARTKLAEKHSVTADRIVRELALVGFSNMLDYMTINEGEAFIDFSRLTRDQAGAIGEVTVESYKEPGDDGQRVKRTKFKLHDKLSALEKLGKHLGMFDRGDDDRGNITVQILNLIGQHPAPPKKLVAHGPA